MSWQPDALTTVTIGANQDNQSSAVQGVGGFERTGANVDFYRSIGPRSALVADLGYEQFAFTGGFGREDDRWAGGVGFEYSLLSRLTVGLQYRYQDRSSSIALLDFTSNTLLLTFTLTPPRHRKPRAVWIHPASKGRERQPRGESSARRADSRPALGHIAPRPHP
ncbi:MAG: hypothetical protein ACI87W_002013 [Halieaceae bacterium]|jgi:hypothetical protein